MDTAAVDLVVDVGANRGQYATGLRAAGYQGRIAAPLFENVLPFLTGHGFAPIAFEGVLDDVETGEMLQIDAIFRRGHD